MKLGMRHVARLSPVAFVALATIACSSASTPEPDGVPADAPAAAPAATNGPATSAADTALVAEAQAFADVRTKVDALEKADWTGGDFAKATIEHGAHGDAVAVRFIHTGDPGTVDLLYTKDQSGTYIALVRPLDGASAKVLASSLEGEAGDANDSMSEADLATIVPEHEPVLPEHTSPIGEATTDAATHCGTLYPGQSLYPGQKLWSCKNGYALFMQSDGNLVLYAPGSVATWSSKTNGKGGYRATMQSDGNFVVYDRHNRALWASGHSHSGDQLDLQADGNLVKNTCGSVSWSSGTYCESGCVGKCTKWSCSYTSSIGFHPSCFSLPDNPTGHYHIQTIRGGRTIPGFCGTGTYRAFGGNGVSCPTSHVASMLICD